MQDDRHFRSVTSVQRSLAAIPPIKTSYGWQAAVLILAILCGLSLARANEPSGGDNAEPAVSAPSSASLPSTLGITFVDGSNSTVVIESEGRKFLVDLVSRKISEMVHPSASPSMDNTIPPAQGTPSKQASAITSTPKPPEPKPQVYEAGDDYLLSLPTGRKLDRHGLYVNFNHRFAFDPFFTGKSKGHTLGGLDGVTVASFGFRYGVTDKLSVAIYRSPSLVARPIQLTAGYDFLSEKDRQPFNASFRTSVEGRNDFTRDFTLNFEGIFSRSVTRRAQIYIVPTISLYNRRLVLSDLYAPPPDLPGINTFSIGAGAAVDIRPSVALMAEVIPTVVNGRDMGIHRPAFAFGIQKKIFGHAFTFGFMNSPGTTTSQRAGTRATFLGDPSADTPSGLFIGFDLSRQLLY